MKHKLAHVHVKVEPDMEKSGALVRLFAKITDSEGTELAWSYISPSMEAFENEGPDILRKLANVLERANKA